MVATNPSKAQFIVWDSSHKSAPILKVGGALLICIGWMVPIKWLNNYPIPTISWDGMQWEIHSFGHPSQKANMLAAL